MHCLLMSPLVPAAPFDGLCEASETAGTMRRAGQTRGGSTCERCLFVRCLALWVRASPFLGARPCSCQLRPRPLPPFINVHRRRSALSGASPPHRLPAIIPSSAADAMYVLASSVVLARRQRRARTTTPLRPTILPRSVRQPQLLCCACTHPAPRHAGDTRLGSQMGMRALPRLPRRCTNVYVRDE